MSVSACLFDSSVWVALAFSSHPHHAEAGREFRAADSAHPAAFCRATQQAFMRIITNDEAWTKWESLMVLPQVVWLNEPQGVEGLWQRQARLFSASPKVWMDAYLAAFAAGHGIPLATMDKDFTRFTGLAVRYLPSSVTA